METELVNSVPLAVEVTSSWLKPMICPDGSFIGILSSS